VGGVWTGSLKGVVSTQGVATSSKWLCRYAGNDVLSRKSSNLGDLNASSVWEGDGYINLEESM